jgi:potassium/hydrogen antiporter
VAAAYILGISLLEGILLGSIVGSTDAAAVFSLLRSAGVRLKERLASTLEIESGSNDPMAIFLTIGLLEVLLGRMSAGAGLAGLLRPADGRRRRWRALVIGRFSVWLINRVNLEAAGLYPVLAGACGLLAYGAAASLGGSGFLAVYLAGIVLGNNRLVFKRGTLPLPRRARLGGTDHDVRRARPAQLPEPAGGGGGARPADRRGADLGRPADRGLPAAAALRLHPRDVTLVAWVGLKGAVPIILATFPLLFGLPSGPLLFNVVFFVVLVSAFTQGWSLPVVARRLGLQQPAEPEPPVSLEITSLRDVDADIVDYVVGDSSRAANRLVRELALPESVVVAMISRAERLIPPRGSTRVLPGDHVFLVMQPGLRPLVDRVFIQDTGGVEDPLPALVEFPLMADMTVAELWEFYGIRLGASGDSSLGDVIRGRLGPEAAVGSVIIVDGVMLYVRAMADEEITVVGLAIPSARM